MTHTCEKCNKNFIKKSTYVSHLTRKKPCTIKNELEKVVKNNSDAEEKINNSTCPHCNKQFTRKWSVITHIKKCKKAVCEKKRMMILMY